MTFLIRTNFVIIFFCAMPNIHHHGHSCQAVVVSCMDFRLRKFLRKWTTESIAGGFDRVAIAGGVKELEVITDQIALSVKLHKIEEAYLINHENCGAYGDSGTFEKHKEDLLNARKVLRQKFPEMKIIPLYLKLDGEFVEVK